ncbi:pseudouridylate synthase 7 homolog [Epargyreus clarus]|uniref:pseudouridylate synthase 7 homolog n=1 Tax=Epargyreus clarus TaxID=520877 RepID=UPI003C2C6EE9
MNNRRPWRGNRGNRGNRSRGGYFRGRGGWGNNGQFGSSRNDFFDKNPNPKSFGRSFQHNPKPNYIKRDFPTKRLSEEEIGVTEYMNNHEGFNGIIKSRYSDFQVSEINLKGEIAILTDMKPPELPKEKDIDEDEELVLNKYNLEILPIETWDNINKLAVAKTPLTDKVQIDVTGMPKEHRTKIHDAVKKAFGQGIVGSTVTVDGKKYVCFEKFRRGVRIDQRVKWLWPEEYVHFIVHKENCDTMEVAARLAERLHLNLKPSMLGYAGTKDRRAKTSQWFSLRKVEPARIAAAARDLRELAVGNYSFHAAGLRLGMLRGNRFNIVLRNVTASDECVDAACELLKRDGFINYYGLQRFGTRVQTPTYSIGLKLFQGDLREAINAILEEREGPLQAALQAFHTAGAEAAWRLCPRNISRFPNELRLIKYLAENPKDLVGAINRVPRNARLLYIHSYQSLIWNKVASERLRRHGLQPVAGDLVSLAAETITGEEIDDEEDDSDNEESTDAENERDSNKADGTMDTNAETNNTNTDQKDKPTEMKKKEIPVKVLTQEDVDSGTYTIFDLVLPLPGNFIKYPPNMVDFYEELLSKDGLTLEMKNKIKGFSMSGAYRSLAARAGALSWRRARYAEPRADLLLADRDRLLGRAHTAETEDGPYKALILSMTLPTSCYATMALRELLKVDTSSDNQALQNNYYKIKNRNSTSESDNQNDKSQSKDQEKQNKNENENEQSENSDGQSENSKEQKQVQESSNGGEKRKLESKSEVDAKKTKQTIS